MPVIKCKFLVTGSMRSGTTYMSSILNGQRDTACIESYPYHLFKRYYEFREDLECDIAIRESEFIHLGIEGPIFDDARTYEDLVSIYSSHIADHFSIQNLGYKRTMLSLREIAQRVDEGYRVIIMRRSSKSILKSWVRRIDSDLLNGAFKLQNYYADINYFSFDEFSDSILIVDYEKLIANKQKEMQKVSDFLGFSIDCEAPRYYSFNKNRTEFSNNSSFRLKSDDSSLIGRLRSKYTDDTYRIVADKVDRRRFFSLRHLVIDRLKKSYLKGRGLII